MKFVKQQNDQIVLSVLVEKKYWKKVYIAALRHVGMDDVALLPFNEIQLKELVTIIAARAPTDRERSTMSGIGVGAQRLLDPMDLACMATCKGDRRGEPAYFFLF